MTARILPTSVDFYLYATHEVPTFLPVIRELRRLGADAQFVLEPPTTNVARGSAPQGSHWFNDPDKNLTALVDDSTFRALSETLQQHGEVSLSRRRRFADAAVTTSGVKWLRMWSGARIRLMYGVGFVRDAYGHGTINEGFDLVLVPGRFSANAIRSSVPGVTVEVVGYPKWEVARSLVGEGAVEEPLQRSRDQATTRVLWVPTWAHHSSLSAYAASLSDLGRSHAVTIKPHHNSERFELERISALARSPMTVVTTRSSLPDLIHQADVVVADARSGALTEALLGDRPVVALLGLHGDADVPHRGLLECCQVCRHPSEIEAAVLVARSDPLREARRQWTRCLFGDGVDDSGRATRAIIGCAHRIGHPMRRRLESVMLTAAYRTARRVGR